MPRTFLVGVTLFFPVLLGCSAEKTREPGASSQRSSQPSDQAPSQPSSQVTISNEEIDGHIAWWRAQLDLGREHLREITDLHERLNDKYSLAELHKVQQDPELLALMARHRQELMDHKRSRPVTGAAGFDSVLAGLGRSVNRDGRMVYEVHHDESALSGARGRFGDTLVDAILSREDDIAAAMSP